MSTPVTTVSASRIGKGRLPCAGVGAAVHPPSTAPAATPDAVKTTDAPDQSASSFAQGSQKPTTPVVSLALDQTPTDPQQPGVQGSRWGKSAASDSGPVFQVVSRGSRLATGAPSSYTPPSHPTKTHATAPRTRSLVPNRGMPNSIASISLRNRSAASGSSNSSSSSSTSSMMAFGSRIDRPTGRLPSDSMSKGSATPPAADNCKSVVRVLSFEDTANSPSNSPATKKQGFTPSSSSLAVPATAAFISIPSGPSKNPAGTAATSLSTAAASSDSSEASEGSIDASKSAAASAMSSNGESPRLLDPEQLLPGSTPPAALRVGFGPLPDVHDAATAAAAAKVLLQQLLDSASSLTAAAGLSANSLDLAGAPAGAAIGDDSDAEASSPADSKSSNSGQYAFAVLISKAAVMLEAGCKADDVRQTVLPALLLQLAGMACDSSRSSCSSDNSSADGTGGEDELLQDAGGAAASAASALKASVQAGVVAAKASMLLPDKLAATAATAPAPSRAEKVRTANMEVSRSSSRSLGGKVVGVCLLLFGGLALLAVGFLVAIAWTILEGGSAWVSSSSGPGGMYSSSAVEWPVEWLYDGRAASGVWGGAVLPGRRFVP